MGTNNININDKNESPSVTQITAKIDMWYGSEKKEQARIIPQANIMSINIHESMFSPLPTIKVVLNDSGNYLQNLGFRHGEVLCVTITPNLGDPDEIPAPYINSKFIIQSIEYLWNASSNDYDYTIKGIYAAEKYLTATFQWPPASSLTSTDFAFVKNLGTDMTIAKTGGFTSDELLLRVVANAGLTYICDIDGVVPTDDRMYWLNRNLTYQEFIKFVVNHAWIAEDDSPIFYVDVNGNGIYSSIKTFQKNSVSMMYKEKDYAVQGGAIETASRFRMYSNPVIRNAGYIQGEGGYKVESNVWNPYHALTINPTPEIDTGVKTIGSRLPPRVRDIPLTMPDSVPHDRCGHNLTNSPYVAKMSNKSTGAANNIRFVSNDFYFAETHQYYDYAPLHNQSMRKAFFNVFLYLTVDCSNQLDFDAKRKRREALGDKISVDFANLNYNTSIQNGNFIISSIMHYWNKQGTYQQVLCCVSDGINGINAQNKSVAIKGQ